MTQSELPHDAFVNALCQSLALTPVERQSLLDCDSVLERARRLIEILQWKALEQVMGKGFTRSLMLIRLFQHTPSVVMPRYTCESRGESNSYLLSARGGRRAMRLRLETERESAERWIADVVTLPGVMAYGRTRTEAVQKAKALALEVIADRVRNGEDPRTGRPRSRSKLRALEFVAA